MRDADSDEFVFETPIVLDCRYCLAPQANPGRQVFSAFVADDQRLGAVAANTGHFVFEALVVANGWFGAISIADSRHFILIALIVLDDRRCVFHADTDSSAPILVALVSPHNWSCSLPASDTRTNVFEAFVVLDDWAGVSATNSRPKSLIARVFSDDWPC